MGSFMTRNKFGRPKRVIGLKENGKGFPTGYYKEGNKVIQVQYSSAVGSKGADKGIVGYVSLVLTDFKPGKSNASWDSFNSSGL